MAHRAFSTAFTLIEIVVSLTILVLMLGLAIPTFKHLSKEKLLRDAAREIQIQARQVRRIAMKEGAPRDLYFSTSEMWLAHPDDAAELSRSLNSSRQTLSRSTAERLEDRYYDEREHVEENTDDPHAGYLPQEAAMLPKYKLDEDVIFAMWSEDDKVWKAVELWRWRFHPTGLCEPFAVRVYHPDSDSYLGLEFSPLSARVEDEEFFLQ